MGKSWYAGTYPTFTGQNGIHFITYCGRIWKCYLTIINGIEWYNASLGEASKLLLITYVLKTRLSGGAKIRLNSWYTSKDLLVADLKLYFTTEKFATSKLNSIKQSQNNRDRNNINNFRANFCRGQVNNINFRKKGSYNLAQRGMFTPRGRFFGNYNRNNSNQGGSTWIMKESITLEIIKIIIKIIVKHFFENTINKNTNRLNFIFAWHMRINKCNFLKFYRQSGKK